MSEKSPEEKAEEYASLLRQGAGNYANLCGVLAGFMMVVISLFLTSEQVPETNTNVVFELGIVLLSIASFGYILTGLSFIHISRSPLWFYKSTKEMGKKYTFHQILVVMFMSWLLSALAVLTFSVGSFLMALTAAVGCAITTSVFVKDWWALAKRTPPKKTK